MPSVSSMVKAKDMSFFVATPLFTTSNIHIKKKSRCVFCLYYENWARVKVLYELTYEYIVSQLVSHFSVTYVVITYRK